MKKLFPGISLVLLGVMLSVAACNQAADPTAAIQSAREGDKVIARVGKTVITESQVAEKEKMFKFGDQKRSKMVDDLVSSRLLYLGAIKDKLNQDPEIQARLQEQTERILGQLYMNQKVASMGKSDKELEEYYNSHKEEFKVMPQAAISHIQVSTDQRAKDILADISSSKKTFEAAAQEYSEDKSSSNNGGRIGQVSQGNFIPVLGESPEINKAIFEGTQGAVLGPFQTKSGFHLIRIDTLEKDRYEDFDKVKRQILDSVLVSDQDIQEYYDKFKDERFKKKAFIKARHIQTKTQAEAETVLAKLKKGEKFEDLVQKLSQDKMTVANGGDLGVIYENGYLPRIGMEKPIIDALFQLNAGDFSQALQSKNGWHIFNVYEKTPEQYHDLASVRKNIISIIASQKRVDQRKVLMDQLEKEFKVQRFDATDAAAPAKPGAPAAPGAQGAPGAQPFPGAQTAPGSQSAPAAPVTKTE
jgi:peptidyl-prolyl cis-trans isomerase C